MEIDAAESLVLLLSDMENDLMAKDVLLSACELDTGSLEKHVRVSALAKVGIFLV